VRCFTANTLVIKTLLDEDQAAYIHLAARTLTEATQCVTLVNRTDEIDYVTVSGDSTGCSSSVGRRGGQQILRLAPNNVEVGCFRLHTIMHEFIHAMGFHHMQSASNRDEFVEIAWDNITPGYESNFNLYGTNYVDNFGIPYDYGSVMHYSSLAFSRNGEKTIVPLRDLRGQTMGQRAELSASDVLRIRRMYNCALSPRSEA